MEQNNDAALMREAARGERLAMSTLWHKYRASLLLSAQGKTENEAELENRTEAAFRYAFAVLQTGRQVANFYALLQICMEKALCRSHDAAQPLPPRTAPPAPSTAPTAALPETAKHGKQRTESRKSAEKRRKRSVWSVIFLVLLNILLLWLLAGLLMQKGILPKLNIGFDWLGKLYYRIF